MYSRSSFFQSFRRLPDDMQLSNDHPLVQMQKRGTDLFIDINSNGKLKTHRVDEKTNVYYFNTDLTTGILEIVAPKGRHGWFVDPLNQTTLYATVWGTLDFDKFKHQPGRGKTYYFKEMSYEDIRSATVIFNEKQFFIDYLLSYGYSQDCLYELSKPIHEAGLALREGVDEYYVHFAKYKQSHGIPYWKLIRKEDKTTRKVLFQYIVFDNFRVPGVYAFMCSPSKKEVPVFISFYRDFLMRNSLRTFYVRDGLLLELPSPSYNGALPYLQRVRDDLAYAVQDDSYQSKIIYDSSILFDEDNFKKISTFEIQPLLSIAHKVYQPDFVSSFSPYSS